MKGKIKLINKVYEYDFNEDVKKELNILVEETLKQVPGVEKIYLFGSYAYGKPNKDSDFDIMVVTENEIEDVLENNANIRYETFRSVRDFDMIIYSREVFEIRSKNYIMENKIINEGKLIYG